MINRRRVVRIKRKANACTPFTEYAIVAIILPVMTGAFIAD